MKMIYSIPNNSITTPGTSHYDNELKRIEHFNYHSELLPFVGKHFDKLKLLLVAESHYLPADTKVILKDFDNWYTSTAPKVFGESEKGHYSTRDVINWFISGHRSRSHSTFRNPSKSFINTLGIDCLDSEIFQFFAFMNYFQRPEIIKGKSINHTDIDEKKSKEIFEKVVSILNPSAIIFISAKAYRAFGENKYNYVKHPASPHWWKEEGAEKFSDIIKQYSDKSTQIENIIVSERKKKASIIQNFYKELAFHARDFLVEFPTNQQISDACSITNTKNMGLSAIFSAEGKEKIKVNIDWNLWMQWKKTRKGNWDYVYIGRNANRQETINCKLGGIGYDIFADNYSEIAKIIAIDIKKYLA